MLVIRDIRFANFDGHFPFPTNLGSHLIIIGEENIVAVAIVFIPFVDVHGKGTPEL